MAVIDSGISGDLPDFKGADGRSRMTVNEISSSATRAGDDVGHGTHVAGIVAGDTVHRDVADPSYGAYIGIAPDADIIALKVADDAGDVTMVDVITALQYAVRHKDELGIRVVNLSLSSDTPGSYRDDPINAAVEFVWHSGIVVVVAAGNRGSAADAVQYPPGNDPYVISVGATDELGTADPGRRRDRAVLEPRRHAGRRHQARRARPGRAHRGADGRRAARSGPFVRRASSPASTSAWAAHRWRPRWSRARRRSCSRPAPTSTPTRSRGC